MIVAGRDEGEPPHLRGDDDDIAEIASLEEVERLPRGHLVELGLIDARGVLRVVVPLRFDVLPAHGPRRNDGDAPLDERHPRMVEEVLDLHPVARLSMITTSWC